jgi:hypothetical protein
MWLRRQVPVNCCAAIGVPSECQKVVRIMCWIVRALPRDGASGPTLSPRPKKRPLCVLEVFAHQPLSAGGIAPANGIQDALVESPDLDKEWFVLNLGYGEKDLRATPPWGRRPPA